MKIFYEQSTFYLLQDWPSEPPMQYDPHEMYSQHAWGDYYQLCEQSKSKKIKIANPEVLPVINKHWINNLDKTSYIKNGDTFDLPEGVSITITNDSSGGVIATLSKSSSPEIPDSSERYYSIDEHSIVYAAHAISFLSTFIAAVKNKKREDIAKLDIKNALDWTDKLKELVSPSPHTVAGTSTAWQIRRDEKGMTMYKNGELIPGTSTEPIPDKLEKPDFEKMALELWNDHFEDFDGDKEKHFTNKLDAFLVGAMKIGYMLWETEVIPRDKTISDLRERVKELEQQLRAVVKSYDANEGEIVHPIIGNIRIALTP